MIEGTFELISTLTGTPANQGAEAGSQADINEQIKNIKKPLLILILSSSFLNINKGFYL
jgi:hypothetical protein